jgi:hypothetical protein
MPYVKRYSKPEAENRPQISQIFVFYRKGQIARPGLVVLSPRTMPPAISS